MLLVMLFVHVGKHSNSRSQMFVNTGVLKSFTMLEFLFNKVAGLKAYIIIKKETPTQVYSCEYCKTFKSSFFRTLVYYTFPKFYVMIDNRYFRVIFNYYKIRPHNRKNFAMDGSKMWKDGFLSSEISIPFQGFVRS